MRPPDDNARLAERFGSQTADPFWPGQDNHLRLPFRPAGDRVREWQKTMELSGWERQSPIGAADARSSKCRARGLRLGGVWVYEMLKGARYSKIADPHAPPGLLLGSLGGSPGGESGTHWCSTAPLVAAHGPPSCNLAPWRAKDFTARVKADESWLVAVL